MAPRLPAVGLLLLIAILALPAAPVLGQGFNRVHTEDGLDVWAVGDGGAVYRSLDGGVTWGSYPLGGAEHRGVAARGARIWIVDAAGNLWRSTDGGYSFSSQQPAGGTPLYDVRFVDDANGWIVGAAGTLLETTDEGVNWNAVPSGTTADLYTVRFHGGSVGWACGASGTLLHTSDGGATWTASTPFTPSRDLYDIDFDGSTVCVAGSHSFCARSTNAGGSWTVLDLHIWSRSDVLGVALPPGGPLWLSGGGGFLRRTSDGGSTWYYPQHAVMSAITSVCFTDVNHGWACAGKSKLVARTSDGGVTWTIPGGGSFSYTWTQKLSNGGASIRGMTLVIDPVRRNTLYCVQGRTVFKSWNLGESWTSVATISGAGSRTNAFLVSPADTLTWLALVQDGDRVTRTTDGGATWTATISIAFTEYGLPLEQNPNKPDEVYFGPEDGKVWKSADFGATWTELSNPGFRSPDDIVVVYDTTGVLFVSDGVTGSGSAQVWKSADGGLNWTLKRTVPGSEIPTIGAGWLEPSIAYATDWSSGGVQRTLDMGETWPNVSSVASAWGADVAKDDPWVAMFAVYSGGKSYLTRDNGATWVQATVSGSNYAVLAYDRSTYLLHQSNGVYKATITQPDMPVDNAQILTLFVPNGGQSWQYSAAETITWSNQNVPLVSLEYQTSPLGPWTPIASSIPGTPGSYVWVIPNAPTAEARVRVSDANDGDPIDASDGTFAILVPGIATSTSSLAFGAVPIGNSRIDTLLVSNPGTGTLVVSSVAVAGSGPFTPLRTSFSVAPGGADTLAVVFEPIAEQAYEDTLVIGSNAPESPTRIALAGTGAPPVDAGPSEEIVTAFAHDQGPNPFGARGTVITYALPEETDVSLSVYNVHGHVVARLVRGRQKAGRYAVRFPAAAASLSRGFASALPSGVYFYRLEAGAHEATKRMVYVR
jgi:photosystem II stability/assembly factor-like uncharacterized protein